MGATRGTQLGMRLREAIERWGSIRKFQLKMKEQKVRGSSYQMVHDYLSGARVPTLKFLNAAASLLGVREAWLLTGSGAMTALEDSVWNVMQDRLGRRDDESLVAEGLRVGMSPAVEALLYETVAQYIATASDAEKIGPGQTTEMFHDIYWLCCLPRELWGFQYGMSTSQLNSYMTAMLLALQLALRPPGSVTSELSSHIDSKIHRLKDVLPNLWGGGAPLRIRPLHQGASDQG